METAKNPPSHTHTLEDDSLCIECGGLAIGGKGVDCLSLPAIFLFNFFLLLLLFSDFCHRFLSCRVRNPLWPIFCWGNLSLAFLSLLFWSGEPYWYRRGWHPTDELISIQYPLSGQIVHVHWHRCRQRTGILQPHLQQYPHTKYEKSISIPPPRAMRSSKRDTSTLPKTSSQVQVAPCALLYLGRLLSGHCIRWRIRSCSHVAVHWILTTTTV